MQGFDRILEHIKTESEKECKEIALKANDETLRINSVYSQKEQDAYWASVNKGSKEIEKRVESLSELAHDQAKKVIHQTQQNALDDVLALTARKLSALPSKDYNELLVRLGIEEGCKPEYLVEHYREDLQASVISALFDSVEHRD